MTDPETQLIELSARTENGRIVLDYADSDAAAEGPRGSGLWRRVRLWLTLIAALAVGIALFLFFLTVLIYVLVPLALVAMLWGMWRRFTAGPPRP